LKCKDDLTISLQLADISQKFADKRYIVADKPFKLLDKLNIARPFKEKLVELAFKIMKRKKITILINGFRGI
jgi:hypothetical protein